jgi:hypothetical protein
MLAAAASLVGGGKVMPAFSASGPQLASDDLVIDQDHWALDK